MRDRLGGSFLRMYERYLAARSGEYEPAEGEGLPVPPPELLVRVVGHTDRDLFLEAGRQENEIVRRAMAKAELAPGPVRILDWGCGCGRIMRWWQGEPDVELSGCDLNRRSVAWVDRNLPFASVQPNEVAPPLPYPDDSFDFVYGISVLTHLTENLALAWMREVSRVLAPNGCFFFTTHGDAYRDRLNARELARFDQGRALVQFAGTEGSNLCAAYFPRSWVESQLLDGYDLIDFQALDSTSSESTLLAQDCWLARKREQGT